MNSFTHQIGNSGFHQPHRVLLHEQLLIRRHLVPAKLDRVLQQLEAKVSHHVRVLRAAEHETALHADAGGRLLLERLAMGESLHPDRLGRHGVEHGLHGANQTLADGPDVGHRVVVSNISEDPK